MKLSAKGKLYFGRPPKWNGDPEVVATAIFAGQMMELMFCEDGTSGYELHFLGFKSELYPSSETAKYHAFEFAIAVLRHLADTLEIQVSNLD